MFLNGKQRSINEEVAEGKTKLYLNKFSNKIDGIEFKSRKFFDQIHGKVIRSYSADWLYKKLQRVVKLVNKIILYKTLHYWHDRINRDWIFRPKLHKRDFSPIIKIRMNKLMFYRRGLLILGGVFLVKFKELLRYRLNVWRENVLWLVRMWTKYFNKWSVKASRWKLNKLRAMRFIFLMKKYLDRLAYYMKLWGFQKLLDNVRWYHSMWHVRLLFRCWKTVVWAMKRGRRRVKQRMIKRYKMYTKLEREYYAELAEKVRLIMLLNRLKKWFYFYCYRNLSRVLGSLFYRVLMRKLFILWKSGEKIFPKVEFTASVDLSPVKEKEKPNKPYDYGITITPLPGSTKRAVYQNSTNNLVYKQYFLVKRKKNEVNLSGSGQFIGHNKLYQATPSRRVKPQQKKKRNVSSSSMSKVLMLDGTESKLEVMRKKVDYRIERIHDVENSFIEAINIKPAKTGIKPEASDKNKVTSHADTNEIDHLDERVTEAPVEEALEEKGEFSVEIEPLANGKGESPIEKGESSIEKRGLTIEKGESPEEDEGDYQDEEFETEEVDPESKLQKSNTEELSTSETGLTSDYNENKNKNENIEMVESKELVSTRLEQILRSVSSPKRRSNKRLENFKKMTIQERVRYRLDRIHTLEDNFKRDIKTSDKLI